MTDPWERVALEGLSTIYMDLNPAGRERMIRHLLDIGDYYLATPSCEDFLPPLAEILALIDGFEANERSTT